LAVVALPPPCQEQRDSSSIPLTTFVIFHYDFRRFSNDFRHFSNDFRFFLNGFRHSVEAFRRAPSTNHQLFSMQSFLSFHVTST